MINSCVQCTLGESHRLHAPQAVCDGTLVWQWETRLVSLISFMIRISGCSYMTTDSIGTCVPGKCSGCHGTLHIQCYSIVQGCGVMCSHTYTHTHRQTHSLKQTTMLLHNLRITLMYNGNVNKNEG